MSSAVLRHSTRDAILVALSFVHGLLLLLAPSAPLIAVAMWWNANTVAHNFIHLPFFRSRLANRVFSGYLSLLLGLPQTLWRDRHMAHHAGRAFRMRWSGQLAGEFVLVLGLWLFVASRGADFFLGTWLLGWAGGLVLCSLQGHYEHVRGTVSHYGRLYNFAFFNDGYHVEHHARPGMHWSELPRHARTATAEMSRWPAVLRWLEVLHLETLERMVLHSRVLQKFVLARHARAFRQAIARLPEVRRVAIVGGGLFPRTALVLHQLLPAAEITVIDQSARNIERARSRLDGNGTIKWVEASYRPELCHNADLLVVPLSFRGDRAEFYQHPPARAVAVHDWIWQRRGTGWVISVLLLKRLNLIAR
jgi:hypothetical protein